MDRVNGKKLSSRHWLLLPALLLGQSAQAALIDRGGGLIYDTDLDITWLWDADYARTSGYDPNGLMKWDKAMTWAADLSYGGYDDWRLPTALNQDGTGPCSGFNCSGSELGHLFYSELGGTADSSISSAADPNHYLSLFSNVQSDLYWSGTERVANPSSAWLFNARTGRQGFNDKVSVSFRAWAVRSGDVGGVPEPGTALLLALGVAGLRLAGRGRPGQG